MPNPVTFTMEFCPNLSGVKELGTSNKGLISAATGWQTVSGQPNWLVATIQTVNVSVSLYWCITVSWLLLKAESPSPKDHAKLTAPIEELVNTVGVLGVGGEGVNV